MWGVKVKSRVYECLVERWKKRESSPGWEVRWLAPIPKIQDPSLDDLRPLMLVEVMRKIWVGLIMEKIRRFWAKWKLIDENQHGFIGGKGTHTAMPHIINCMEAAKDFKTDMYMSSWDMKRAFDSLGREFVISCLERLHIPKGIAEYLTGLDSGGKVYVRSPENVELMKNGKLEAEGEGFETGKGVGQGDVPSPLLWVAAFDTLLTALGEVGSDFKVQDLNGRTYAARDVAYADDLISVMATLAGLQRKADIISGWCKATGVKISHSKLRTFGVNWGVDRGQEDVLRLRDDKWELAEVEVKPDGVMTYLGVIWNMDMYNEKQFVEVKKVVEGMGQKIMKSSGRMRDKIQVLNACLKSTILYRLQYCT